MPPADAIMPAEPAPSSAGPAPVLFLGDSHVKYFRVAAEHHLFAPRRMEGREVGGATAVGMRNPNAMTNALGKFRDFMRDRDTRSIVVMQLGEVDCGYVIWYRAQKYDDSVESQLEESIATYFAYLDDLRSSGFTRIVVTGATLPTITDSDQEGEVVVKRSGIKATQRERTDLTFRYNARLKAEAERRGLLYTEVTDDVLDPDTRLVRSAFRNRTPTDHHMHYPLAAAVWAARLNACLDRLDPLAASVRTLRAVAPSFATGLTLAADDLPDELRVSTRPGDVLTAEVRAEAGDVLVLDNATLNGKRLDPRIRLVRTDAWASLPAASRAAEYSDRPAIGRSWHAWLPWKRRSFA